jgi:putative ABC transport system permease protein
MFKNYITIAFRNLLKHKVFSFINIFGLSVGIACCMLLALYIKDEFSYEKHFDRYEDIYRVTSAFHKEDGKEEKIPRTSPPVAMAMLKEFPELESATRVVNPPEVEQHLLRYEDKTFYEKKGYLVDSTFFDIFSYEFQEGDRITALDDRATVVLSDVVAKKIFGDRSGIDELIIINSGFSTDTFRVTGVLKPYTRNSQLDADFYISMNSEGWGDYINRETTWIGNNFVYAYIKVKPGTPITALTAKFPALLEKHGGAQMKEMGLKKTMSVQALKDARLYSAAEFASVSFGFFDIGGGGNILYVYILTSICIFILLIACINFMNLATAKASQRAGEVGVRKSLGANRQNLIGQFLGESMTIVVISMIMSVGMVQMILPTFNYFTQKDLSLDVSNVWYIAVALIGISLITGLIAGSYPAFYLSSFQPAKVLKDRRLSGGASNWLRKGLVVFQFVISITLISSIIIIYKQLNYIQSKSLGFNPEYRVLVPIRTSEAQSGYSRMKDRLEQLSGVKLVSASSAAPSMPTMRDLPLYKEGSSMEKANIHFNINVDENYFKLLDINVIAGRELVFEKDSFNFDNNLNHVMINRASCKINGMTPEEAVGSKLLIDFRGRRITFEIEGVVEDFHQMSMHQEVPPMVFLLPADKSNFVSICASVEAGDYQNTLANMEKAWKEINPNTPFESMLLSDNVKQQYESDQRNLSIISAFTVIAILISCLGLYGLSIYVAERRVKEIGIRKVLGASVPGIIGMLSKDFIKLVAIAFIISIPVGYYAMDKWLQNFAYKIELDALVFVLAGVVSFSIAWITIGFESIRAAMGNPVDSLKND